MRVPSNAHKSHLKVSLAHGTGCHPASSSGVRAVAREYIFVAVVLSCVLAFSLRPGLGLAMLPSNSPSSCLTCTRIMGVHLHIRAESVCFQQVHRRWLTWGGGSNKALKMAVLHLQANTPFQSRACLLLSESALCQESPREAQ